MPNKGRSINATGFTETEFNQLKDVKGDRDWETAILEEFDVEQGGGDE